MNFILLDLFPLLLLILFLIGVRPIQKNTSLGPEGTVNQSYLSKEMGNAWRGLFAIVVLLHHLSQRTDPGLAFRLFRPAGYLAVAVFFFFSGYGLQKSHMASENYQNKFLQKRLLKILLPYAFVTLLYWVLFAVNGTVFSLKDVALSLVNGDPIAFASWYILSICYFYVVYWLFMLTCKRRFNLMVLCAALYFVVYAILCRVFGYDEWWYNASHLLVLGMLWATHEQRILHVIAKRYYLLAGCTLVGFLASFGALYADLLTGLMWELVLSWISAALFVGMVLLVSMKIRIQNPILQFLGKISMEIYLIHGLFMRGLRSELLRVENDFLWACLIIVGSVLLGWGFNKLCSWAFRPISKNKKQKAS